MVSAAVAVLLGAVLAATELLFKSGGLERLMQLLADTLDQVRATAPAWIVEKLPESADAMQHAVSEWLRGHAHDVQRWSGMALKILVHIIIGLAIGLMAATCRRNEPPGTPRRPLVLLARARMLQLATAFGDVFAAQLRISLINASLTGIYLLVVLPMLGYHVPLGPTLVGFTFFASLVPIIGNLLSNAAVTVAALTVSVWLGLASLGFLVVIHKLEYFLNARIVGGRTNVPTYAMLASMLLLEAAFGVAGLVAAPIFCALAHAGVAGRRLDLMRGPAPSPEGEGANPSRHAQMPGLGPRERLDAVRRQREPHAGIADAAPRQARAHAVAAVPVDAAGVHLRQDAPARAPRRGV